MKRLEFRLDTVLRLRELQLERERAQLLQLTGEQRRLESDLETIRRERQEAKAFLYEQGSLENAELRTMSAFLLGMDARTGVVRGRLEEIARSVEQQRQVALAAERKVRLLEKLRERKREAWKQETNREIETVAQEAWQAGQHVRRAAESGSRRRMDLAPQQVSGLTGKVAKRNRIHTSEVDEKTRDHVAQPGRLGYASPKVICAD